jgi:hypothetical protein
MPSRLLRDNDAAFSLFVAGLRQERLGEGLPWWARAHVPPNVVRHRRRSGAPHVRPAMSPIRAGRGTLTRSGPYKERMLPRLSNDSSVWPRGRLVAALFGLVAAACTPKPAAEPVPSPPVSEPPKPAPATAGAAEAECAVDADCVPASCCHPASCVPAAQKPDCTDVMCTMQCAPDTMDCGGRCACEAGSCKAILATSP